MDESENPIDNEGRGERHPDYPKERSVDKIDAKIGLAERIEKVRGLIPETGKGWVRVPG